MWDINSDPVIVPVSFYDVNSSLSIKPVKISIRFLFIIFPSRSINVKNNIDLDEYFNIYLISQKVIVIH